MMMRMMRMNDYKELIENLRDNRCICDTLIEDAADAIEQLVKERDAIAYDLSGFRDCSSCRHAMKYKGDCADLSECKWEWRGV